MRCGWLVAIMVGSWACGSEAPEEPGGSCVAASKIISDALAHAIDAAPACASDDDCVVMSDSASCDVISIQSCGMAVHRKTLELYDRKAVDARLCELAEDAAYGCDIQASCAETGDPVCRAGECVFSP